MMMMNDDPHVMILFTVSYRLRAAQPTSSVALSRKH